MPRPWLSVIVPVRNGSRYVRQALDSLAAQDGGSAEIEVIAVDDGSDDGTLEILSRYRQRLNLVIERLRHNGNWVANANHGMRLAQGEYLCVLHQDDAWTPSRLRVMRRLMARHRDAVIYVHPCWYADAAGRRIGYWRCPFPKDADVLTPRKVLAHLLVQCLYGMPAPLFRASAAREVGMMDDSLWFSADWDFWIKLSSLGDTVYCPTPLAIFRVHAASQTFVRGRGADEIYHQQIAVLERHRRRLDTMPSDVWQTARFSIDVNAALLRLLDGRPIDFGRLTADFCTLGPRRWPRYFRDSRVVERCLSRLQAGAIRWRKEAVPSFKSRPLLSARLVAANHDIAREGRAPLASAP